VLINVHNKIRKNYVKNEKMKLNVKRLKKRREKAEFLKEWCRKFIKIEKIFKKILNSEKIMYCSWEQEMTA